MWHELVKFSFSCLTKFHFISFISRVGWIVHVANIILFILYNYMSLALMS